MTDTQTRRAADVTTLDLFEPSRVGIDTRGVLARGTAELVDIGERRVE